MQWYGRFPKKAEIENDDEGKCPHCGGAFIVVRSYDEITLRAFGGAEKFLALMSSASASADELKRLPS